MPQEYNEVTFLSFEQKLGHLKEAKECQEMELRILEALFGAAHPRVKVNDLSWFV